ncbi:MAG: MarR family transcriptional regulator [Xanthobacteraceae bacterium]
MSEGKPAQREAHQDPAPTAARRAERPARLRRKALELGVLNSHLGYFVRRLQVWVFQDFMRALASVDVRPAQYSVLVVIEANPGLPQSDIAEFLGIERARLARMLDRLEKRGFTERRSSPKDRRSHALYLTREGQKTLKRIKALAAAHEAQLAAKLGPEKRKLLIDLLRDFDG